LVINCEISECSAIELNLSFFEAMNKAAIVHAIRANSCINTDNPETTESTFTLFSVAISIAESALYSFDSAAKELAVGAAITFGEF
jgi:hypothetical protein